MSSNTQNIESVSQEARTFAPPEEFTRAAHVASMAEYERLCAEAAASPESFWAKKSNEPEKAAVTLQATCFGIACNVS